MSSPGALLVLFDADCGFCARCAMVLQQLDRSHRLAFLPLQDAASVLTGAPSREELAMTLHVRDLDGRWVRGGAACLRIAAALPVLMPLAFAGRLPFASVVVEGAYRLVARNRHRLSRVLGRPARRDKRQLCSRTEGPPRAPGDKPALSGSTDRAVAVHEHKPG